MQTLSEKILDGLQRCLPETDDEGMSDCISCPYNNCCDDETEVNLPVQMVEDIRELLKAQMDPIKPVKTVRSNNQYGVDGVLIVGSCPACGQGFLNNRDNKFCGGCGRPVKWYA